MNIFNQLQLSGRALFTAVALLVLQIPVSHQLFSQFLEESSWHFHLVITSLAIALLLAYRYGFRGGILSSVLSTVIVGVVELANSNVSNGEFDVSLTVAVGIATLATGVAASVAVGLLAHILQAQRKWLEALFASASDGFVVVTKARRVLAMNDAAQQISGWSVEELAAAGGCAALFGCGGNRDRCPGNAACPASLTTNPMPGLETEIIHKNGSLVPVSVSASTVELPFVMRKLPQSTALVLTVRDIATARRLQAELEGLAKVCSDISSLENVTEILQEIASRARSILSADLVTIALVSDQGHQLTLCHVAGPGAENVTGLKWASGEGVMGRAHRIGSPIVIRHPADDPTDLLDRDPLVKAIGLLAQVAVPFGGEQGISGVIGAGWYQPRTVLPNQVTVLRQLANLAGGALENSHLLSQIQRRRQEADVLYHLGLEISSLSDFDCKLEFVLDETRTLTNADVTALWVVDEREQIGAWKVVSAANPAAAATWLSHSGQGLVAEAAQAGRVLLVEHLTAPVGLRTPYEETEGPEQFRAAVALPLRVRGKTTGALFAGYRSSPRVDEDSVRFLSGLSNQLSVALENARLYRRVQDLAVIEERHRLSREIHDGLAQILSVLNLRAEVLKKGLVRLGLSEIDAGGRQVADLTREVEEFQVILGDAYGEVRHSIWTLRGHEQSDRDLASLLCGFVEQFRLYTGMSVALETHCSTSLRLPMSTELHLIRIVQEALNNVRRHAGVTSALLSVRTEDRTLILEVRDQGRGFIPDLVGSSGKGGYGLASMYERALAIGAELVVQSHPGSGTTVTLNIGLDRLQF